MIPKFTEDSIPDLEEDSCGGFSSKNRGHSEKFGEVSSLQTQESVRNDYSDWKITGWTSDAPSADPEATHTVAWGQEAVEPSDMTVVTPSPPKEIIKAHKRARMDAIEQLAREVAREIDEECKKTAAKRKKLTPRKTPWGTLKPTGSGNRNEVTLSVRDEAKITKKSDPPAAKPVARKQSTIKRKQPPLPTKAAAKKSKAQTEEEEEDEEEEDLWSVESESCAENRMRNAALPPDSFIDYDDEVVDVKEIIQEKWWEAKKILEKKKCRGGGVQYLVQYADTWETRRMSAALMEYDVHGYYHERLDVKQQKYNEVEDVTFFLCRWAPVWTPAENVTPDLIAAFNEEQKAKARRARARSH